MPAQTISIKDLTIKNYQVTVVRPNLSDGVAYDVTPILAGLSWNYDIDQPVETYEFDFLKVTDALRVLQAGWWIFVSGYRPDPSNTIDYGIIKSGIIWDVETNTTNGGMIKVTAHDVAIYLTNNKGSHRMEVGEKASDFIKRISPLYGIQLDTIEDTQMPMPYPLPFINQSLWDMFATALQNTRDLGFAGRVEGDTVQFGALRYFLQTRGLKVALVEKREQPYHWLFEAGDKSNTGNIIDASNKFSLDNYRNVVKVYSSANPDISGTDPTGLLTVEGDPVITAASPPQETWATDPDIKKYGMLSESVNFTDYTEAQMAIPDLPEQAQWQADDMLRRLKKLWNSGSISTFNIPTMRAGDSVYVNIPSIGMSNKYYVKSGSHQITASSSTMTLQLQFEDLLPFIYRSKVERQTDILNLGL